MVITNNIFFTLPFLLTVTSECSNYIIVIWEWFVILLVSIGHGVCHFQLFLFYRIKLIISQYMAADGFYFVTFFLPYLLSPWAVTYFSSSLTVSCCNVPFRDMSSQSYSLYVFRSRLLLSVCLWVDLMDSLSLSVVRCSRYERTYFSSTANFVAYSLMASVSLRVISDELNKRFNWALGCQSSGSLRLPSSFLTGVQNTLL